MMVTQIYSWTQDAVSEFLYQILLPRTRFHECLLWHSNFMDHYQILKSYLQLILTLGSIENPLLFGSILTLVLKI